MITEENLELCIGSTILDSELLSSYDKSTPIFHYTSPEGLLGILQEKETVLWFSQYDSLNDTTEGVHILEVYRKVCKELFDGGKINWIFYQAVKSVEPMTKAVFLSHLENLEAGKKTANITDYCKIKESQKYVCCFSKNRDSLPMWNYYTKEGKYEGYNIGFCFWRTKHAGVQDCYGKGYNFDLFTVIYDDEEKKKIIRSKMEELYSFYEKTPEEKVLSRIKNALSYYLKNLGLKFKQECFQHEKEVRAILTVPKEIAFEKDEKFKVKYRNKAGYIIPYIEVKFPVEIVSGITVGPLLNDQTAINNIRQFSRSRQYLFKDDDIQPSEIPIRY